MGLQKFVSEGCFLKFARDIHGLFGGDEYAMKAASLEAENLRQCVVIRRYSRPMTTVTQRVMRFAKGVYAWPQPHSCSHSCHFQLPWLPHHGQRRVTGDSGHVGVWVTRSGTMYFCTLVPPPPPSIMSPVLQARSVVAGSHEVQRAMNDVGRSLNIKPHVVG